MSEPAHKVLRVEGGGFRAVAVWRKESTGWACIEAPPVLDWIKGMSPPDAKAALARRAWTYSWH